MTMNRKGFLNRLFLGAAAVLVPGGTTVAAGSGQKQKVRLAVTLVAGFPYYDGPEAEPLLEEGMPLLLNREPHNPHDRNAIEVWAGDAKLGYVPRSANKTVARMMDKGIAVEACILEVNQEKVPGSTVKIELFYLRDTDETQSEGTKTGS